MEKTKTMVHNGVEVAVIQVGTAAMVRLECSGVPDQYIKRGSGYWYYTGGTLTNVNTTLLNTMIDAAVKDMVTAREHKRVAQDEVQDWFNMHGVDAEE